MIKRVGHINLSAISIKVIDGVKVCLECAKPVTKRRRKYCSSKCSDVYYDKRDHARLRIKMWHLKKEICWKCGTKVAQYFILDHVKPIAIGGAEFEEANLQILCEKCNKVKTKQDAHLIAQHRRIEQLQAGNQKLSTGR